MLHAVNALANIGQRWDLHRIQQLVKWTVYLLVFVNFCFYLYDDVTRASHALHDESTIMDMLGSFATSSAVLAWLLLLAMFELETYAIEDAEWNGWVARLVHGLRLACFLVIAHTVFAFAEWCWDLRVDQVVEPSRGACALIDSDLSWTYNLEYWDITADNCEELSASGPVYRLGKDAVVTDAKGLRLERQLALADVGEIVAWLIIILAMEVMVRLQGKGVTDGPLMRRLKIVKYVLYGFLSCLALWWNSLGHTLYLWDTFLWIAGFAAIEMNLSEWRDEILEERSQTQQQESAAAEST